MILQVKGIPWSVGMLWVPRLCEGNPTTIWAVSFQKSLQATIAYYQLTFYHLEKVMVVSFWIPRIELWAFLAISLRPACTGSHTNANAAIMDRNAPPARRGLCSGPCTRNLCKSFQQKFQFSYFSVIYRTLSMPSSHKLLNLCTFQCHLCHLSETPKNKCIQLIQPKKIANLL